MNWKLHRHPHGNGPNASHPTNQSQLGLIRLSPNPKQSAIDQWERVWRSKDECKFDGFQFIQWETTNKWTYTARQSQQTHKAAIALGAIQENAFRFWGEQLNRRKLISKAQSYSNYQLYFKNKKKRKWAKENKKQLQQQGWLILCNWSAARYHKYKHNKTIHTKSHLKQ